MPLDIEAEVRQNTRDIGKMAVDVQRVVTMVEHSEKRQDDNAHMMEEIFSQIKEVNEKVSATVGMKDDIHNLREDVRTTRTEVGVIQNSIQQLGVLNEKVSDLIVDHAEKYTDLKSQIAVERKRVDDIEKRNAGIDGGAKAISWGIGFLWTVFGGVITSAGIWFFSQYFQQTNTVTQSYQSKQVISGE